MQQLPAAATCKHFQSPGSQRLRHIGTAKYAGAAMRLLPAPRIRGEYTVVACGYAGAEHAVIPSAVGNGDCVHRRSNLVLDKPARIRKLFFQFGIGAVCEHGMRPGMRLHGMSMSVEFAQLLPLHILLAAADPPGGHKKNCTYAVFLQQRQCMGILGDMAIIKSKFQHRKMRIGCSLEAGCQSQVFFELLYTAIVGIRLWSRPYFVIDQKQLSRNGRTGSVLE